MIKFKFLILTLLVLSCSEMRESEVITQPALLDIIKSQIDPDFASLKPVFQKEAIFAQNSLVLDYLNLNYPHITVEDNAIKDPAFFIFGITFAIAEKEFYSQSMHSRIKYGDPSLFFRCALDVVAGYLTIETLIADYKALFTQSASWTTIRPVVLNTVRRYAGWTIAIAVVYDITTQCVNLER